MLGYYNDEERTEAAFEGGWFHSRRPRDVDVEGYISIVDRKKDMIKTGGENVASREVEEVIYRLAGVKEVAVIGLPHPTWVEAVVAVVVLKEAGALTKKRCGPCSCELAHFKVPKRVVFVDELPKNPSGKIMKRALREQHQGLFG